MLDRIKGVFSRKQREEALREQLEKIKKNVPVPVFWLFGKTQTGKTSIIRFLTGAEDAEIGHGFRACTRFTREYWFPSPEAPLLRFFDTRGVDEPGYDPAEDLDQLNSLAHVVLVTVKALDHSQENILRHLKKIRAARPTRPVLLCLTCLHEAYPQKQHPLPYPFQESYTSPKVAVADSSPEFSDLLRSLDEQTRRFAGSIDYLVPIDLTRPEDGFEQTSYGGDRLKKILLEILPFAYRQTLLTLGESNRELQDWHSRQALPHIVAYSTLAATAGALPIPWVDLLVLPGIQTQMIYHLARLYGQSLSATRFFELASTLGVGVLLRQGVREVMKFIPYVGSVAGGALAGASTFALGKAFCFYYSSVHKGHVPSAGELKKYYQEQLHQAETWWAGFKPNQAVESSPRTQPT